MQRRDGHGRSEWRPGSPKPRSQQESAYPNRRSHVGKPARGYRAATLRCDGVGFSPRLNGAAVRLPDPREHPTLSVEEAGRHLGLGRATAYAQARVFERTDGREGIPVLRFGRTLRVPTAALLRMLGVAGNE